MTAHAKLSASGSHRWMACPGSVRVEQTIPDTSSEYADEGTAAHFVAALCLEHDRDAQYYLGYSVKVPTDQNAKTHFTASVDEGVYSRFDLPDCDGREFDVDEEMVDAVQQYLDYCRDQVGTHFIEQRVDYHPWVPDGFGTSDFICIRDGVCTVVDLKYGKGIQVDADNNPQAMLYGLGVFNEFGFLFDCDKFKLVIVQPRKDHVSEWTVSREDLLAFGEEARSRAAEVLEDDAPLIPSTKACRFCRARGSCRALAEHNYGLAAEGFEAVGDPVTLKKTDQLTIDELAHLLDEIDILAGWADTVKSHAISLIMQGNQIPGFKLVEGKTNRKWADEEAAGKALARKLTTKVAFSRKLMTITDAEKHLGKKHPLIAKHTTKPDGKPTLAAESSPKPALKFDPTDGFEDIQEAA